MVKILTILFLFLANFCFAISNENGFPKYSKELTKPVSCSCSGVFSSCSSSGNCTCTCGYFTCSCTSEKRLETITQIDISISKEQFKNIEKLAKKLHEIKSDQAVDYLAKMIECIKINDVENFQLNRKLYIDEINKIERISKNKLNAFFESLNAEERI